MHPMLREIIEDELRLDAENTAENERRIEALTWKRVGYYAKSELAHAYYERGDVIAANRQMYSAIPDFLELEKEMLQLKNRLLDQRSYESQGYKHTWCDIRREFDLIYWRTMDFADDNLEKEMYSVRKRLMLSYYHIWSEWVSQPDIGDYLFLIELTKRGKNIDADPVAPLILNYAFREHGCVFAFTSRQNHAKQKMYDQEEPIEKYHEMIQNNEINEASQRLLWVCSMFGTGTVPRSFIYAVCEYPPEPLQDMRRNNEAVDSIINDLISAGYLFSDDYLLCMNQSLQEIVWQQTPAEIKTSWFSILEAVFFHYLHGNEDDGVIYRWQMDGNNNTGDSFFFAIKNKLNNIHCYYAEMGKFELQEL